MKITVEEEERVFGKRNKESRPIPPRTDVIAGRNKNSCRAKRNVENHCGKRTWRITVEKEHGEPLWKKNMENHCGKRMQTTRIWS